MTRARAVWVLLAVTLVACAVTLIGRTAAVGDDRRPLLKVAVFANGTCGKFADSLPTLVSRTGVRPGDVVSDITVCVKNDGRREGAVNLRITERAELDIGCTGQEAASDSTCGSRRRGELGPSLYQQLGVGPCASPPPALSPSSNRWLPALEQPISVGSLAPSQVFCARLVLAYSPPDPQAGIVSQSDRTTWRYVFGIAF